MTFSNRPAWITPSKSHWLINAIAGICRSRACCCSVVEGPALAAIQLYLPEHQYNWHLARGHKALVQIL
jgi:hypothetical protein